MAGLPKLADLFKSLSISLPAFLHIENAWIGICRAWYQVILISLPVVLVLSWLMAIIAERQVELLRSAVKRSLLHLEKPAPLPDFKTSVPNR
jgi:hypothetical protein